MNEYDNFFPTKVKVDKCGVVDVTYKVATEDGENKYRAMTTAIAHPELIDAVSRLRRVAVDVFYGGMLEMFMNTSCDETEEQKAVIKSAAEYANGQMGVNGCVCSDGGVVICSEFCRLNTKAAINTPKISFDDEQYGVELRETLELIRKEVYLYLFKNKTAQLELFGDD